MRQLLPLLIMPAIAACSSPSMEEPSLAPRAAETIDPRVPIPDVAPVGTVDPALAARLSTLVSSARFAEPTFNAREAEASRLAASAGPMASEGWVAAQQALSQLVKQYGATPQVAADIDALASGQLGGQHWIRPADRQAITAAAAEVAEISDRQAAAIDRIKDQLAR
jgi:hypothetical protein